ncbi:hypothetical protein K439DRAFT_1189224 [Ramaria rubella]|nr:hypothetical protein K439DRAFT_1189224 [Ramaria rubella]
MTDVRLGLAFDATGLIASPPPRWGSPPLPYASPSTCRCSRTVSRSRRMGGIRWRRLIRQPRSLRGSCLENFGGEGACRALRDSTRVDILDLDPDASKNTNTDDDASPPLTPPHYRSYAGYTIRSYTSTLHYSFSSALLCSIPSLPFRVRFVLSSQCADSSLPLFLRCASLC